MFFKQIIIKNLNSQYLLDIIRYNN